MSTDKILDKLAKMMAHAESAKAIGNAEEAAAFAGKIQELLTKHELSMSDIEYTRLAKEDPIGETGVSGGRVGQRRQWQERLARVLAHASFCKILISTGSDRIWFVGRASHRQAVEYVYTRLRHELEETSKKEYKRLRSRIRREGGDLSETHDFKDSFRDGYIRTIALRLKEQRAAATVKIEAGEARGTAMVRLETALVKAQEYIDEKYSDSPEAKSLRTGDGFNPLGYQRGVHHGKKANLEAGATGSTKKLGK